MLNASQKRFLKRQFPGEASLFSPEEMAVFGADAGKKVALPWAVVRPEDKESCVELLSWAHREKVPLIFRARGTNTVGATLPVPGGVVVSCLEMNEVLDISEHDFAGVVQPGVITGEFQKMAAAKRLLYPPDPASAKISTIGGNIMTNAGGLRAVKYGVTRDYVLGLEVVLPGGKVIRTGGRPHKNVMGLDLTRLMVGSEGTLGMVTEATVKLLPLPETTASVLVGFEDVDGVLHASRKIFEAGMLPVAMEFMADEVIDALEKAGPVPWPKGTGAMLLLQLDGSEESLKVELRRLTELLEREQPSFLDYAEQGDKEEELWDVRRSISPSLYLLAPDKFGEDLVVPRGKVGNMVEGYRMIGKDLNVLIVSFGHLGDGNLHIDIMYDGSDDSERKRANKAREELYKLTLSLGGTITGEHGIGSKKYPYVGWQLNKESRALMHGIKRVFDPRGILNPGKAY